MTEHTIGVVPEAETLNEAYNMGFDRYEPAEGEVDPAAALDGISDSAEWANIIAPKLRALAGYVDSGHGTYRVERTVAVVRTGDGDDLPRDAVQVDPNHVFEKVVDAYRTGVSDALEGREADDSNADPIV